MKIVHGLSPIEPQKGSLRFLLKLSSKNENIRVPTSGTKWYILCSCCCRLCAPPWHFSCATKTNKCVQILSKKCYLPKVLHETPRWRWQYTKNITYLVYSIYFWGSMRAQCTHNKFSLSWIYIYSHIWETAFCIERKLVFCCVGFSCAPNFCTCTCIYLFCCSVLCDPAFLAFGLNVKNFIKVERERARASIINLVANRFRSER